MKQTRRIKISRKIFLREDLHRIAQILARQQTLAQKADHHSSASFSVSFDDESTIESDSAEIFDDENLVTPARPIAVHMRFLNYKLEREISFSLFHGDGAYPNYAEIRGLESPWIAENFMAIQKALDIAKPQQFWLRRHQTILLNVISLGIGSLVTTIIALTTAIVFRVAGTPKIEASPAVIALVKALFGFPGNHLFYAWLFGFSWGAFTIRRWLLELWPNIEFQFGLARLRMEQERRRRLTLVVTLVVLPITANLLTAVFITSAK